MSDSVTSKIASDGNTKTSQTLISNDSENLTIHGYKSSTVKCWITYSFYLLTLGLLRLVFHWFPTWKLYSTHSKCSLTTAEKILIVDKYRDKYETHFVEKIQLLHADNDSDIIPPPTLTAYLDDGSVKESVTLRVVACKKLLHVWNDERHEFVKLCGIDQGRKCIQFHEFKGYTASQQRIRQITYGKNTILVPSQTVLTLFILEALTPFYIFQVFSLGVWFAETYYYYTIAIVILSVFGISSSIIQTRKNQRNLHKSVDSSAEAVTVSRGNGVFENILTCDLVPGDVIEVPDNGFTMQCDAVLLNGTCIVNESMLTGESVPITKTPIPKTNSVYDVKEDGFHTLFCGTKVIQTQSSGGEKLYAVVLRTGYLTTKGELVRSILYPPPSDFKFDNDSYKYIGILSVIAILGCIYTIVLKSNRAIAPSDVAIKTLTLLTVVIPPALPAAMTVGKLYALSRLKKHNIFCINSRVINVSGSIDCVCFDKTGTLTEDSLDMWGVVPVVGNTLGTPINEVSSLPQTSEILKGMATCHNISIMDKQLIGDPLDIKVFESTGWNLETGNLVKSYTNPDNEIEQMEQIEICRHFQFSSTLQRMSVIVKSGTSSNNDVYCKGSPEKIATLSKPETVPVDLHQRLKEYTSKGYRVIALANKPLQNSTDFHKIERSDVEQDLNFIALIILENCLKPETLEIITDLRKAKIKTTMITGDNIQTAVSVAKECGIINSNEVVVDVSVSRGSEVGSFSLSFNPNQHLNSVVNGKSKKNSNLENGLNVEYKLAISGTDWALVQEHFPDEISEIVSKGAVFARMSGQQKQQLIQELQRLGYYVAMCGDGANDCGALKAAHVGISLSEAEASVASPFTSRDPNISCVPKVIKEGRAALTTSIGVFKFMICYSLTQFASTIVLYGIDSNLTNIQYLYIDICLALNFMMVFGKTEAYKGPLHKRRPLTSLLSFIPVLSLVLQMFLIIVFQILAYKIIQTYDWFKPFQFNPDKETYYSCYENYAVFAISMLQYNILALCFSKGKPFRMPFYTNKLFLISLIIMSAISVYILVYPAAWVINIFELVIPPNLDVCMVILGLALANLVLSLLVEDILIEYIISNKILPRLQNCMKSPKKFVHNKKSLQLPVCLSNQRNSVASIIYEGKSSKNGFINGAFQNSETQ